MSLVYVDPRYLDSVWPQVEGLLASAIAKANGETTLSQLRAQIVYGTSFLVVWTEGESDKVISAGAIEFMNFPNYRVAHCSFLSGEYSKESFEALKRWCQEMGASKIQCWGSDAIARLYERYGMEKKYNVLRIDL
jgi:hypothetical protein